MSLSDSVLGWGRGLGLQRQQEQRSPQAVVCGALQGNVQAVRTQGRKHIPGITALLEDLKWEVLLLVFKSGYNSGCR